METLRREHRAFRQVCQRLTGRPFLRVAAQLVSAGLIVLLIHVARRGNLGESLGRLRQSIALVVGLGLLQVVLASCRWQILLRQVGVREPLSRLGRLYLIGLFFSLFLPTSSGGDAVRIYEVARRRARPNLPRHFARTLPRPRFGTPGRCFRHRVLPAGLASGIRLLGRGLTLTGRPARCYFSTPPSWPEPCDAAQFGCRPNLRRAGGCGVPPRWCSGLTRKLADMADLVPGPFPPCGWRC